MIGPGIANSSPFIALGRIGRLDLLKGQFDRLLVPCAVAEEVGEIPPWVEVLPVADPRLIGAFPVRIHRGDAEVIVLGLQTPGSILVLDDWHARAFAQGRGITVIGTVGLILRARRDGHIPDVQPVLGQLTAAGFRLSDRVRSDALRLAGEE